jgi:hypothetical protein
VVAVELRRPVPRRDRDQMHADVLQPDRVTERLVDAHRIAGFR